MSISGIKQFFDLSIRDQVAASIVNGGSDNMFLFSGPPLFTSLNSVQDAFADENGGSLNKLCPLLYTNSFQEPDSRSGRGTLNTLGGKKSIAAPNTGNPALRTIQIGAMSLVTGHPNVGSDIPDAVDAAGNQQQWNLLKRAYWWAWKDTRTAFTALWGGDAGFIGNQGEFPDAVSPDAFSTFGNFGRSSFYEMPLGIFAIAVNKGGKSIKAKYYEGANILGAGPELGAQINGPITVSSTNGLTLSFSDVKTFTQTECQNILGTGTSENLLLNAINASIEDGDSVL